MASYSRNIQANVELSAYIRLPRRYMRCSQLGGYLRRNFNLRGFVEVREHGNRWYSATFSCQFDYDQVFPASSRRIFGQYSIELYRWQPNFQFGEVMPPFCYGGPIVEGRVEGLPLEYWRDDVVIEIANAVCQPWGCRAFMVDTRSEGKLPRFLFQSNGLQLPLQIQIRDGPAVGLSYSRPQPCCKWDGHGHTRLVSNLEPRQWTRSSGYGRTHAHRRPSPNVDSEENGTPSSAGITSPPRTVTEKNMPAKGAIIIEQGEESIPTLYTLGEDVSEIDVAVKVTHLNDQRGNLRQLTINPHIGAAPNYNKRVLCTSIDGADAASALEDMCHDKGASLVVVLDKSSVLVDDDQIGTRLGFSASRRAEMTFPRVGVDGSALDVKGNCLLMWKEEEVDVSPVDTEPSSHHLKFSASWLIDESRGVTTRSVEDLGNYSDSSAGSDLEGPSSYPTAPEELSSESAHVLPIDTSSGDALTSNYGDTVSGEERPYEDSTSSSSSSESTYSGPAVYDESPPGSPDINVSFLNNGDIDGDESSGDERFYLSDSEEDFSTDAEEISCGSSAPSASSSSSSEEDDYSRPDGDTSTAHGNTDSEGEHEFSAASSSSDTEGASTSEEDDYSRPDGDTSSAHGNTDSEGEHEFSASSRF